VPHTVAGSWMSRSGCLRKKIRPAILEPCVYAGVCGCLSSRIRFSLSSPGTYLAPGI
jgi:hypothetical protein